MKLIKLIAALGVMLLGAGAYLFQDDLRSLGEEVFGRAASAKSGVPLPSDRYQTAVVKKGDVRQTVTATGTLNALVAVEVGTQLSGQLAKLLADFNDHVTKGQPLAELDRRTFEAKAAEARAATIAAQTLVAVQQSRIDRARVDTQDAQAKTA